MADHIYTLQVYIENTQTGIKAVGKMKYLRRQNNLLKKRSALKTLGYNIPVKNNDTEEFKYTYSSKIELSPVLLAQIEEYLEECKKI